MERTLCVWYPDWPLRRPDAPSDRPAQVVDATNRVVALNELARAAEITVGMRRREAEAVCPTVVTFEADPGADAARFEPVALAVENLIPRLEVVAPGLMFAPIDGALTYYGGEAELVDRVEKELDTVGGFGFRIGVGAGPFAARRAADLATIEAPIYRVEDDVAFLSSLDIDVLGREEMAATFRWLGITTLGELSRLPRAAIVSRFGTEGLEAHRLASGEDRTTQPRPLPPDLAVEERFAPPLENLEQAGFAARAIANRLLLELAAFGAAPHRVEVEAEAADGAVRTRIWRSLDPFDDATLADRIRWQLQAWLDHARRDSGPGIRGGLVRLRVAPAEVSDEGRQLALHEDARSAAAAERSLSQTQAILGPDRVLQARLQGGRSPRERVAWHRWGEPARAPSRDPDAPWPGAVPSPSPALVPPEPVALDVEWDGGMPTRVRLGSRWVPVLSWAGPWRQIGRWWDAEHPCERYQLVTSAGAFLCEVRESRTVMVGVYD
jgi:protein ImuB